MADDISEVVKELRERAGKILLLSWRDDVEVLLEAKELMAEMCVALPALLDALEGQTSPVGKGLERPSGRVSPAPTLLGCPFCGGEATLEAPSEKQFWWRAQCAEPECTGSLTNGWSLKSAAIDQWNRRAPSPGRKRVVTLFDAIAHGDEDHRAWLKEALDAFFAGRPVPPPRSKPSPIAAPAVRSAEREVVILKSEVEDWRKWRLNGWKAARKAAAKEAERWSHNMGGDDGMNIARRIRALSLDEEKAGG